MRILRDELGDDLYAEILDAVNELSYAGYSVIDMTANDLRVMLGFLQGILDERRREPAAALQYARILAALNAEEKDDGNGD